MDYHAFEKYPEDSEYFGQCLKCGKDIFNHDREVKIPIGNMVKTVPLSYAHLLQTAPPIPGHLKEYIVEGEERYNVLGKKYLKWTEYGYTNNCYLPTTDTVRDVEEELMDALFNVLVLYWKKDPTVENRSLNRLWSAICDGLTYCQDVRNE